MCGIAGILAPGENNDFRRNTIGAMTEALTHRGPDDSGLWLGAGGMALGHRRLAITDSSADGAQPFVSHSGRFVLTFNGEIYNYLELRARLQKEFAHPFRSRSDTEVLLVALEAWGLDVTLPLLNGVFAFGLWDITNRTLTLARDRLGEKPLYYGLLGGSFYFASEVSAFAEGGAAPLTLSETAIAQLVRRNCIAAPSTIFNEISMLPPAHTVTVSVGPQIRLGEPQPFWQIPETSDESQFENTPQTLQTLEALIEDAVKLRMNCELPVGAFLSGGVDSTLVTALMQKHSSRPVSTFTIGFENEHFDESKFARAVAHQLGTAHEELILSERDILNLVPAMAQTFAEPFADSSQLPMCLLAGLARKSVKVVLSGDGGDEFFCGYDRYQTATTLWARLRKIPFFLRVGLGEQLRAADVDTLNGTLSGLWRILSPVSQGQSIGDKMKKAGSLLCSSSFEELYSKLTMQWLDVDPLRRGRASGLGLESVRSLSVEDFHSSPRLAMHWDQRSYLPNDILTKVDRATMAVGLESRMPLLDHRVVEFAGRLPYSLLVQGGIGKPALRKILAKHVPESLTNRPKRGFGVPLGEWLRGPLRDWADDLLSGETLNRQGIFDTSVVSKKWISHRRGDADYSHDLWPILMFQSWLDQRPSPNRLAPIKNGQALGCG